MQILRVAIFVTLMLFVGSASLRIALAPASTLEHATTTPNITVTIPLPLPSATTTPEKMLKTQKQKNISSKTTPPTPLPTPPPVSVPVPRPTNDELYAHALARTVNLLCQKENGEVTIATAFFVNASGVLLTNGHVTEALASPTCTVRRGAPARDVGTAHLLYLPQAYTATSSYQGQAPFDISLWSFVPTTPTGVPTPYFIFENTIPSRGTVVTTFSYPAELVAFSTLVNNQYPLFSDATIDGHDATTLALTSSAGAQKGSSGGVVMNPATMSALGIIFGVSNTGPVSDRTLYALTFERINAIITNEFGISFTEKLSQLR